MALEVGLSFFVEGAHAFVAVFCRHKAVVGFDLELHGGPDVRLHAEDDGFLGLHDRERRVSSDRGGGFDCRRQKLRGLAYPVHHAPGERPPRPRRGARKG